jgi:hypothetical protein
LPVTTKPERLKVNGDTDSIIPESTSAHTRIYLEQRRDIKNCRMKCANEHQIAEKRNLIIHPNRQPWKPTITKMRYVDPYMPTNTIPSDHSNRQLESNFISFMRKYREMDDHDIPSLSPLLSVGKFIRKKNEILEKTERMSDLAKLSNCKFRLNKETTKTMMMTSSGSSNGTKLETSFIHDRTDTDNEHHYIKAGILGDPNKEFKNQAIPYFSNHFHKEIGRVVSGMDKKHIVLNDGLDIRSRKVSVQEATTTKTRQISIKPSISKITSIGSIAKHSPSGKVTEETESAYVLSSATMQEDE